MFNLTTSIRKRMPRATTIIALLALFAALSGSAVAAKHLITGKQVAKNTLTGKNVKDGSLKTADLNKKAVNDLKGKTGPQGPEGPQGPAGVVSPLTDGIAAMNVNANTTANVATIAGAPQSKYMVSAKLTLSSSGTSTTTCFLEANDQALPFSAVDWKPSGAGLDNPVSTQALAPAGTTKVELVCQAGANTAGVGNANLIAVPVS